MNGLMNRLGLKTFASIFPKETLNMGKWLVGHWYFRHERKIIVTLWFIVKQKWIWKVIGAS